MKIETGKRRVKAFERKKVLFQEKDFLEIEGDLALPRVMLKNKQVWMEARDRAEEFVVIRDNRFVWYIDSGAEINICENIYDYLVFIWSRNNRELGTGEFEIAHVEKNHYIVVPRWIGYRGKITEEEEEEINSN